MVHVAYFTDPLCPWSWAAEPQLRRILVEFSDQVQITYVMAGMARTIHAEQKLASTLAAAADSGMPADPRLWLECPPSSSYPACRAVKAAAGQGLDAAYLRRLREGVFLRREPFDDDESLTAAAGDVQGLDPELLAADLRSGAAAERFEADRQNATASCGEHRPSLPAFSVDGGTPIGKAQLRDQVLAAGAQPGALPDVATALPRFGTLAAAEAAAVCGLSSTRTRVALWRLVGEGRAAAQELVLGELFAAV